MSILLDLRGGNGSALANKGILSTVCFVALTCLHSMWSAVFIALNIIYSMHNVGGSRPSSGIPKTVDAWPWYRSPHFCSVVGPSPSFGQGVNVSEQTEQRQSCRSRREIAFVVVDCKARNRIRSEDTHELRQVLCAVYEHLARGRSCQK